MFQLSVCCEKCVAARYYAVIWKQLFISNERNRVRRVVLGLSEDGACTDLFENLSVNSLGRPIEFATTFNPSLFSLLNTFNYFTLTRNTVLVTQKVCYLGLALAAQAKLSMRSWPCILAASSLDSNLSSSSIISESSSKSVKWLFTHSKRIRVTW